MNKNTPAKLTFDFQFVLPTKVGVNKESETPWYNKVTREWSTSIELCCCLFLFRGDYHCDEGPGGGGKTLKKNNKKKTPPR